MLLALQELGELSSLFFWGGIIILECQKRKEIINKKGYENKVLKNIDKACRAMYKMKL